MLLRMQLLLLLLIGSFYFCSAKRYFITRYGACSDCGYQRYSYQWCNVHWVDRSEKSRTTWDYCSTEPGHSTRGDKCKNNCEYYATVFGYGYYWCYLEKGGWDYCSRIEEDSVTYYSTWNEVCENHCDLGTKGGYQCRTKSEDHSKCSLVQGITWVGMPCKSLNNPSINGSENTCGYHKQNYRWCWTDDNGWNYCSKQRNNLYSEPVERTGLKKLGIRESSTLTTIQTTIQYRRENLRLFTFVAYESPDPSEILSLEGSDNNKIRKDAYAMIYAWHKKALIHGIGAIPTWKGGVLHMFKKPYVIRNGRVFANFQLELGRPKADNGPTTVAVALVEIGLEGKPLNGLEDMSIADIARYIVISLYASLRYSAKVWVWQELARHENGEHVIIPRS